MSLLSALVRASRQTFVSFGESLDYPCRYLRVQTRGFPGLGHAVSKCPHFHFYIAASSKPTPCSVGGADVQRNVLRGVLRCSEFCSRVSMMLSSCRR